jgi:hypothetical protein
MRYRPRFNDWGARFVMHVDDELLSLEMAHQLLSEAGQSIGIGDFRPEKRGPFGRFRVVEWKIAAPGARGALAKAVKKPRGRRGCSAAREIRLRARRRSGDERSTQTPCARKRGVFLLPEARVFAPGV